MSTRGAWGFIVNEQEFLTYNHCDSYPDGLGTDILRFLRSVESLPALRERVLELRIVKAGGGPTADDQEQFSSVADRRVSTGRDWYSLLRRTQGDPAATLSCGVMIDNSGFLLDSLFCEWAYIIDLDAEVLEVYEGFQKTRHTAGRFANMSRHDDYFPVKLIASYPLSDLPSDKDFVSFFEDAK